MKEATKSLLAAVTTRRGGSNEELELLEVESAGLFKYTDRILSGTANSIKSEVNKCHRCGKEIQHGSDYTRIELTLEVEEGERTNTILSERLIIF